MTIPFTALDTSQSTRGLISGLRANGITAVGRYYTRKRNSWKILTATEARELSDAGIRIWAVYQNTHRARSDFSAQIGKSEAEDALDYAQHVIGQPRDSTIYFSADFDASDDIYRSNIRPHFEAIGAAFAAAGSPYRIGIYSSGAICKSLLDDGLVQYAWLSQSSGFRGTREFKASNAWHLLQWMPVPHFAGFEDKIDPDQTKADFGGFLLQDGPPERVVAHSAAPLAVAAAAADASPAAFADNVPYRGRPLLRGEIGSPDVKLLQARLNEISFGPLVVDGDFGEGTQNAVYHFQARNASSDGKPLAIDGEVGATTWAALFGPGSVFASAAFDPQASMRDLVIDIAASQIGVVEQPRGSNRGPEVDVFIRAAGLDPSKDSYPWCVCFLYWVFSQAAAVKQVKTPMPKTAGVISLWDLGRKGEADVVRKSEASAQTVKPGMIFLLDTGGGKGHAGLVIEVRGDHIVTIEGNTNPGGSSDGFGVFRRDVRPITTDRLLGYLDFCSS